MKGWPNIFSVSSVDRVANIYDQMLKMNMYVLWLIKNIPISRCTSQIHVSQSQVVFPNWFYSWLVYIHLCMILTEFWISHLRGVIQLMQQKHLLSSTKQCPVRTTTIYSTNRKRMILTMAELKVTMLYIVLLIMSFHHWSRKCTILKI